MTGTSCDGADLAVLEIGQSGERLTYSAEASFPSALRTRLREAQKGQLDIRSTGRLTKDYSEWVAAFCRRCVTRWKLPAARTLVAVHGQTVWHEPENGFSVQLVDPAILVARTGLTVTAAFRQPDLAFGGEGAPLLPYYHWLRAHSNAEFKKLIPFAIHNVGGIGNLTYVTHRARDLLAFDTGPGNALMDIAVERLTRGKKKYDDGGKLALGAFEKIDWDRIEALCSQGYFKKPPPKSTGRELFNESYLSHLRSRGEALVADATALTAHSMAKAYADFIVKKKKPLRHIFVAGGGANNPVLMRLFENELMCLTEQDISVSVLPEEFAPPKALEAMGFARFGYEALHGRPVSVAAVTGASEDASGAGIFPGKNYASLLKLLKMSR